MDNRTYKVILSSFKESSNSEVETTILKSLDLVKQNKVKNINELIDILSSRGIDKRLFEKTITDLVKKGNEAQLVKIVSTLGEKGIRILRPSWLKRNIEDDKILKEISQNNWHYFRDENWIKKNKLF